MHVSIVRIIFWGDERTELIGNNNQYKAERVQRRNKLEYASTEFDGTTTVYNVCFVVRKISLKIACTMSN